MGGEQSYFRYNFDQYQIERRQVSGGLAELALLFLEATEDRTCLLLLLDEVLVRSLEYWYKTHMSEVCSFQTIPLMCIATASRSQLARAPNQGHLPLLKTPLNFLPSTVSKFKLTRTNH